MVNWHESDTGVIFGVELQNKNKHRTRHSAYVGRDGRALRRVGLQGDIPSPSPYSRV